MFYINNVLEHLLEATISTFADDIAIFFEVNRWQELKILTDRNTIINIFNSKLLTKPICDFDTLHIQEKQINLTEKIKYLGV